MAATEQATVQRAQRGDRAAFGELVRLHHARLIATARALVRDADAAEDISQDAFVEAFRSLPTLRKPERFRAWLFGIARHKALNHLRTAYREVPAGEMVDGGPGVHRRAADATRGDLRERLDELAERDREILAAKYLQDLSYDEIAEALGITVNTVRVRCCRARQRLRELLSEEQAEAEEES